MTCRIVFLDLDGVLCTPRAALALGDFGLIRTFDPVAVAFLNRLYEAVEYEIVVSSTWRREAYMPILLQATGIHAPCFRGNAWRTGEAIRAPGEGMVSRPREIATWITENGPVDEYLILDDDHFSWTEEQESRWIQCDYQDGISLMAMQKAFDLFGAEWSTLR